MKHIIFTLLFVFFGTKAFGYCILNASGDNICDKEKALLEEKQEKDLQVVFIKHVSVLEPKALIKVDRDKKQIHIDKLIGNKVCTNGEKICSGVKVRLDSACSSEIDTDEEYKVQEAFTNEYIEIKTGGFLSTKTVLIPQNCIREIL